MSEFTTPLILRHLPDQTWEVWEKFEYHVGELPSKEVIAVPVGFITDLASIPRILWPIFSPFGRYSKAAVLHDWCYVEAIKTKKWADLLFLEAMEVLDVPYWKRTIMYYAVRLFGRGNYK